MRNPSADDKTVRSHYTLNAYMLFPIALLAMSRYKLCIHHVLYFCLQDATSEIDNCNQLDKAAKLSALKAQVILTGDDISAV